MSQNVSMTWKGANASRATQEGAAEGLYKWAEHVLEEANRIVPLQEGMLQDTGAAHRPGSDGLDNLTAAVTFDTPYAVRQHEEMDFHHPGGRQAKYLETPANASRSVGEKLIQQEIKKRLG